MKLLYVVMTLCCIFFFACSGDSGGDSSGNPEPKTRKVKVSWDAHRGKAVNSPGGGYKVFYSNMENFNIEDNGVHFKETPYVSGGKAPTSISLDLTSGLWYIKVIAYSNLGGASTSEPSAELSIEVIDPL